MPRRSIPRAAAAILVAAATSAWANGATDYNSVTPVQKVIQMLTNMAARAKKEKNAEAVGYAKFDQFCKGTIVSKGEEIAAAAALIEGLVLADEVVVRVLVEAVVVEVGVTFGKHHGELRVVQAHDRQQLVDVPELHQVLTLQLFVLELLQDRVGGLVLLPLVQQLLGGLLEILLVEILVHAHLIVTDQPVRVGVHVLHGRLVARRRSRTARDRRDSRAPGRSSAGAPDEAGGGEAEGQRTCQETRRQPRQPAAAPHLSDH
mmetsp:Transcript_89290/g.236103  ORF Transcript_89290/g.236103 Transcript_89290/m.236103 type:complete len:261 (-) Transcript_89290:106-888(-)